MNYCTKCQSIYSQPGTCNCYAPAPFAPYVTNPLIYPTTTPYIPWFPPITITGGIQTTGVSWTKGTHPAQPPFIWDEPQ
jgi:hypothetical protein